ncbi:MAG: uroporphyrinogen-III C-methyltransferase [Candidatus Melainabacteria bacterium]|nr:uroporphyrinogen-III C-methyltransferase [Candidatus Melainabacteria bacterium]
MEHGKQNNSIVYITGAGPGDPGLLTLKAKEIIERADVIAYDNLVSKEILELALFLNKGVKIVYVGKVGYKQEESVNQEKINNLLLELSKDYKIICRLKGGDPNVFGRGGEEALFLKKNNINFEFIPGVSSISAVPAYSGIPLTHRDCSSSFTVISAHEDPFDLNNSINWKDFEVVNNTLVLLMGVKNLPKIAEKLVSLGRSKDTPVAIIYWGTTNKQKSVLTTLQDVSYNIKRYEVKAPSVIIIGKVVNYKSILDWFETKTLFGKKILITRSKEQSFSFVSKLLDMGTKPINCPIVSYEIVEKEIYNKNIINNLSKFNWIFFTSQNAVRYFFEILNKNYFDSRVLANNEIAAVGYKTKLELEKHNIKPDFVPKRFSFDDLINELSERINLKDKKILHPTQVETLRATSLQITHWPIYEANFVNELDQEIINQIKEGIDVITFFSSSTARHFAKLIEKYDVEIRLIASLTATIGDKTSDTVKQLFGKVDIIADPFTEDGLINSMEKYYARSNSKIKTKTTA